MATSQDYLSGKDFWKLRQGRRYIVALAQCQDLSLEDIDAPETGWKTKIQKLRLFELRMTKHRL